MQTQFCWIPDLKSYQCSKFQQKTMSYEGDINFQRWQLNSARKQVSWRNMSKLRFEASKPASKFLFQQFSSSKSKLEDLMQGYFFFLGK
jgi:tRNA U38,U39,U40 pseudouridine synthase TruA